MRLIDADREIARLDRKMRAPEIDTVDYMGAHQARVLIMDAPTIDAEPVRITGDTSDGYHTFNELYHHRAMLFSVICANHKDKAWKSKRHSDATMYDGMFIVGIDTPEGQATYHYDVDPYWDMFDVQTLARAPGWDGHTPKQAIERIGGMRKLDVEPVRHGWWAHLGGDEWCCTDCGFVINTEGSWEQPSWYIFCPHCGTKMDAKEVE